MGRAITFPDDPMAEVTGTFRVIGVVENVAYDGLAEQGTRRVIRYADGADPRAGRWDVYVPLSRYRGRDGLVRRGVQRIGGVADRSDPAAHRAGRADLGGALDDDDGRMRSRSNMRRRASTAS